jgi:hypothetical protein
MSANDATYYSDEAGWQAATRKYCGLAVSVKNRATGKSKLMYIGDAFDPAWVTRVGHVSRLYHYSQFYADSDAAQGISGRHGRRLVLSPR